MAKATKTTNVDALLLEIAKKHLDLETLQARNVDDLDFKEQAVWTIEAALKAAFEAGRASK